MQITRLSTGEKRSLPIEYLSHSIGTIDRWIEVTGEDDWVEYVAPAKPPLTPEELEAERIVYNLQQNELRRETFSVEADPIKLNEDEYAIRENRAPDYDAWLAKKDEIRERFPYRS